VEVQHNHLANVQFIQMIREFWSFWQTQRSSFVFLSSWWDAGKICLHQQIHSFCQHCLITSIKNFAGITLTVFDEIILEWVRFCGSLFSSQSLDLTTQTLSERPVTETVLSQICIL
jgi:hypothetical protein